MANACPFCSAALSASATTCIGCGAAVIPTAPRSNLVAPPTSPGSPSQRNAPVNAPVQDFNGKSRTTTGILSLLLGGLGIHHFYLGSWGWGLVSLLFCWTYIPSIIAFIRGILFLCMSDAAFDQKYNHTQPGPFTW